MERVRSTGGRGRRALISLVLGVGLGAALPRTASADTVVALVSERSAAEFAAAGKRLASQAPEHRWLFRSTRQLARMGDEQLHTLARSADVLVAAAVYGDDARRLDRLLSNVQPATVVPLHGDARLLRWARVRGRQAFSGLSPDAAAARLRKLASGASGRPPVGDQSAEQVIAAARRYRDAHGAINLERMFRWLLASPSDRAHLPPPQPGADLRVLHRGQSLIAGGSMPDQPVVALLDYAHGDEPGQREAGDALCQALESQGLHCISVLAGWGEPSLRALQWLGDAQRASGLQLAAVVVLQDFVIGGGAGAQRAATLLGALDVPVFKGVRMADRGVDTWRVAEDGLPDDSVHYRLAMPELQGVGQPTVLAAAGKPRLQVETGLQVQPSQVLSAEVARLAARIARFRRLQQRANHDKRIAVVYYNHPPGRHNIGADNLDVPASLLSLLRRLKEAGYDTGPLPEDTKQLLAQLQARGVNLPEDGPALSSMAREVPGMSAERYARVFDALPSTAQRAMADGPLDALWARVEQTGGQGEAAAATRQRVERVLGDVQHLLEGVVHPARSTALALLETLRTQYDGWLAGERSLAQRIPQTTAQLRSTGIEGLSGWGPAPGRVMAHAGRLVFPALRFGKVLVAPQPPRGWELNEELLHANLAFPPPHQYVAFYAHLREEFKADAVVHLGRHSTYEFLPGRRTGLGHDDFPSLVIGDLPSIYIYIVDGVGEGIQAKRRGQAVIVDHLTPSLTATPLYDDLLGLRQLVESYEAASGVEGHAGHGALQKIHETIARLNLRDELAASMRPELEARGIGFEEADSELLVHEVGHYLTQMQERFMPHGLHVFGQAWSAEAVTRMARSMAGDAEPDAAHVRGLRESPDLEAEALLRGLRGGFVHPGPGNDPVRTPEVLPTGRNFHALDASVLPTKLGYGLGAQLAADALAQASGKQEGAEAVVLWASDAVRDEGAMVAFGMHMLGVVPRWHSRGIVRGIDRRPLAEGQVRRDTTFVASGLFRDLYGHLLDWLDTAVLVALEGAAITIRNAHPDVVPALEAALAPLQGQRVEGRESLRDNQLAAHWVESVQQQLGSGVPATQAGPLCAARIFGDPPGSYGAGINRLAERSGAWQSRDELASTYVRRMGHAYGGGRGGAAAHEAFRAQLGRTEHTYLGRASNLYGLLDNNDVFDYLGGLGMAVEGVRGTPPRARVVQHADARRARIDALPTALMQELRGQHLNPTYLRSLMPHGYAGARTMGSGFVENLWGWQVTSPHIVKSWAWDEVHDVYLRDRHQIGLADFLADGDNVHVKTNIQAVLLVAAHKGFWQADAETLAQLSEDFAQAVVAHGLPGSGHTRPDHPMLADVLGRLDAGLASQLQAALDAALGAQAQAMATELTPAPASSSDSATGAHPLWWASLLALGVVAMGFQHERRRRSR